METKKRAKVLRTNGRLMIAIPASLRPQINTISKEFGYETDGVAARNCIRIALKIREENPDRFQHLLKSLPIN